VVLRFLEGENEGVEIRVNPPRELFIGRSEECDIFLGEKKISRKHCKLAVSSEGVHLIDLKSTNGTFVNQKKVAEVDLTHEDKIRVGTSLIQVAISADGEAAAPPPKGAFEEPVTGPAAEMPHRPAKEGKAPPPPKFDLDLNEPSGVIDLPSEPEEPAPRFEPEKPKAPAPKAGGPLSGNLSAMGLADLLQNLSQNQKSGILTLHGPSEGKIWVHTGRVVGAALDKAHGTKALYRMLGWTEGEFALNPLPAGFSEQSLQHPIQSAIESLLMEGFRQFDELEKIRKGLPPFTAALKLKPHFTAPLSKLHPRVLDVLQVVLNNGTFQATLDASPLSDLETSKVVFYLIKKEYLIAA
jgi:hypothetical protein